MARITARFLVFAALLLAKDFAIVLGGRVVSLI